jgi:hypothetical protein
LFSADLSALDTSAVGFSIFLLVPVCLGHRRFGFAGYGLSKVEDLRTNQSREVGWQGLIHAALPPREKMQRGGSIPAALHEGWVDVRGLCCGG